ncbi:MAG: AtpZ/AtpI family protein [Maritimibacter sp.]
MPNPLDDLPKDRLQALEERINQAKGVEDEAHHMKKDYSQANHAWRMVIELVAGLGIGFLLGYGLDILFGTLPIFLVIFTLLGLAAGIKTMMASAQELGAKMAAKAAQDEDDTRGN